MGGIFLAINIKFLETTKLSGFFEFIFPPRLSRSNISTDKPTKQSSNDPSLIMSYPRVTPPLVFDFAQTGEGN